MEKKKTRLYPFYSGKKFFNNSAEKKHASIIPSLAIFINTILKKGFSSKKEQSRWVDISEHPPTSVQPTITWLGHSTFLIQIANVNILTDPIFGGMLPLFPRMLPVGIPFKQLPQIHVVLISHNHRDHMDEKSLMQLKDRFNPAIYVPMGDKRWFDKRGFKAVSDHTWWEKIQYRINKEEENFLSFSFLPAHHWSQRVLFRRNCSLWGSWMISYKGQDIYFAGDSAYDSHFKAIAKVFPNIVAALLPIGPCKPAKWLKHSHMDIADSIQAFVDLGAQKFIPMHWGTFGFGFDRFDEPIRELIKLWSVFDLDDEKLFLAKVGQQIAMQEMSKEQQLPFYKKENLDKKDLQI